MASLFFKIMTKLVRNCDPRLEKYRPVVKPKPYAPKTKAELFAVLRRSPKEVLSDHERDQIASLMSFSTFPVSGLMVPKTKMIFLNQDDFLGPLTLDKLYKAGSSCFPVLDDKSCICGLFRTDKIDPIKASSEDKVSKYLEKNLCFARSDYSLEMLLAAFLRTDNNYCIVINHEAEVVGYITLGMLAERLLSSKMTEHFDQDSDIAAVANRSEK